MSFLSSKGTLRDVYSIGKILPIKLRNNSGVLEIKDYGGNYIPVLNRVTIVSTDTILNTDYNIVIVKGDSIIELPTPISYSDRILSIKSGGQYTILISANGDTIDGDSGDIDISPYASINLFSDGSEWYLL